MNRRLILEVPFVTLAAILVAVFALAGWLICLPAFLVNPKLTKPITSRIAKAFQKQMVGYVMGGAKRTPRQSLQSVQESPQSWLP